MKSNTLERELAMMKEELAAAHRRIAALQSTVVEQDRSFDLRCAADMRAIRRWQDAHPSKEHTWPDHTDLVVWLMGQLEGLQADLASKQKALDAALLGWA